MAEKSLRISWSKADKREMRKILAHFKVTMALDLYEIGEMSLTRKQRMSYLAATTQDNFDVYVKMNELDEHRKTNMARNRERKRNQRKGK